METTILGYMGIILCILGLYCENGNQNGNYCWGYIWIMETKMESTGIIGVTILE